MTKIFSVFFCSRTCWFVGGDMCARRLLRSEEIADSLVTTRKISMEWQWQKLVIDFTAWSTWFSKEKASRRIEKLLRGVFSILLYNLHMILLYNLGMTMTERKDIFLFNKNCVTLIKMYYKCSQLLTYNTRFTITFQVLIQFFFFHFCFYTNFFDFINYKRIIFIIESKLEVTTWIISFISAVASCFVVMCSRMIFTSSGKIWIRSLRKWSVIRSAYSFSLRFFIFLSFFNRNTTQTLISFTVSSLFRIIASTRELWTLYRWFVRG